MKSKKMYVAPKMQAFTSNICSLLVASNDAGRCMFLCPHIPETTCSLYDEFIRNKFCISRVPGHEEVMREEIPCPYKNSCEDYELFCRITNDRQR